MLAASSALGGKPTVPRSFGTDSLQNGVLGSGECAVAFAYFAGSRTSIRPEAASVEAERPRHRG
jgi:hypothetical protein